MMVVYELEVMDIRWYGEHLGKENLRLISRRLFSSKQKAIEAGRQAIGNRTWCRPGRWAPGAELFAKDWQGETASFGDIGLRIAQREVG